MRFLSKFRITCLGDILLRDFGSTVPDFELENCQYKKCNISFDKDLVI